MVLILFHSCFVVAFLIQNTTLFLQILSIRHIMRYQTYGEYIRIAHSSFATSLPSPYCFPSPILSSTPFVRCPFISWEFQQWKGDYILRTDWNYICKCVDVSDITLSRCTTEDLLLVSISISDIFFLHFTLVQLLFTCVPYIFFIVVVILLVLKRSTYFYLYSVSLSFCIWNCVLSQSIRT